MERRATARLAHSKCASRLDSTVALPAPGALISPGQDARHTQLGRIASRTLRFLLMAVMFSVVRRNKGVCAGKKKASVEKGWSGSRLHTHSPGRQRRGKAEQRAPLCTPASMPARRRRPRWTPALVTAALLAGGGVAAAAEVREN